MYVISLKLTDIIKFFNSLGESRFYLVIPFEMNEDIFIDNNENDIYLGSYTPNYNYLDVNLTNEGVNWRRIESFLLKRQPIFFLGPKELLTKKIFMQAIISLQPRIYFAIYQGITPYLLSKYIKDRLVFLLSRAKRYLSRSSLINRVISDKLKVEISKFFFRYKNIEEKSSSHLLFAELLAKIYTESSSCFEASDLTILINNSLAAGGAERQLVNTLFGLKEKAEYQTLKLYCNYLEPLSEYGFYLPLLKDKNIAVESLQYDKFRNKIVYLKNYDHASLMNFLPIEIFHEILALYMRFKADRPKIVHAWQDSTSIKAAIAALIAGVPRIIISLRNVAPVNFAYYQPYMDSCYKALAELPHITFVNNSSAGAESYAKWLQIPVNRFIILRNGVNLMHLTRLSEHEVKLKKQELGIPSDAVVLGSMFRFYSEKRPMLWVEIAIHFLQKMPSTYVVLAGDGPYKKDMLRLIKKNNLESRFIFTDKVTNIAPILSIMDVFLLASKYEGTPNVVLEAEWLGIPVFTTEAGGAGEAINDKITGILVKDENPALISDQIINAVANNEFRNIRFDGPKFVKENFAIDTMVNNTVKIYQLRMEHV
ncbi:glycosyltransferase [Aquella oligotrophica]|uniref:Glycosyl transferase family 1 domain-containing protein n=1 Tax=Aquella oligotrophica TaxID=2067065 RepID=A0A2I7N2R9_9NEIS|nr:glycosyltransferase [Aquella oligotrophica]AUR50743.1 hypothetical protein CUN60_00010 [Aquella oligotrophica]